MADVGYRAVPCRSWCSEIRNRSRDRDRDGVPEEGRSHGDSPLPVVSAREAGGSSPPLIEQSIYLDTKS